MRFNQPSRFPVPLRTLAVALTMTVMALSPAWAAHGDPAPTGVAAMRSLDGLLPMQVDNAGGRILVTLPPPAADGVSARFLYSVALRTGLGAAPTMLDRGRIGATRVLAFRSYGKKIAIAFENPRFRPADGAASPDFATSVVWMGEVADVLPDGRRVVDIAGFLATDTLGIVESLNQSSDPLGAASGPQGAGKAFKLDAALSAVDPSSLKLFPDNLEVDAVQTYASDTPGAEVGNIADSLKQVSFTVHHSFVRLPAPGFSPRAFDPRIGGFSTQVADFGAPLGGDVVRDYANRFRLVKVDPAAARSRVARPIVFYVDSRAPEPIRSALVEGIGWWSQAFDAAGYIDAFQVKVLPPDIDPMDARYNIVNWVDRATRGWSFGQEIVDPRTGEIVKGMVVLGSLRARQDIQIFEGLVGAAQVGSGGPNDPVQVALARLRQLGAHEVGHALGFAHNFAASTQGRASVMDYPAPRIALVDGRLDLSDAYDRGIGAWDRTTVDWLYGEPANGIDSQAAALAKARAAVAAGQRYVSDDNARAVGTAQPWAGLWDDGADPTAELQRMLQVRRVAVDHFGLDALEAGEPVANLQRRFVPIWLLHRYQVAAAAKSIGGVELAYAVKGDGREQSAPVAAARQRAAIDAVVATLSPDALRVPTRLLPLLTAARNGSSNRQYDIELMDSPSPPVFDPLVAADTAATISLRALLAPARLARLSAQHAVDASLPGVGDLLDRIVAVALPAHADDVSRRIGYRAIVSMAQVARMPEATPEVSALLDQRVHDIALALGKRGSGADRAWSASLSRKLLDPREREALLAERPRGVSVPPGEPIGEEDWMDSPLAD
jgi:hypothetical protein